MQGQHDPQRPIENKAEDEDRLAKRQAVGCYVHTGMDDTHCHKTPGYDYGKQRGAIDRIERQADDIEQCRQFVEIDQVANGRDAGLRLFERQLEIMRLAWPIDKACRRRSIRTA